MKRRLRLIAFLFFGHLFFVVGIIGIFLPLLPTTPFILLACACYARGSPKLHSWMVGHKQFGPAIRAWEKHRAISKRAKVIAVSMIVISIGWGIVVAPLWSVKLIMAIVGVSVSLYIITRPSGGGNE